MNQNYSNIEEIVKKMQEYYDEVMANRIFGEKDKSNVTYQDLQLKLLQTTQEFARGFEGELENAITVKSKVKVFIKRVIRKSTRFMLKPYAEQMLKYQEMSCELLGQLINYTALLGNKGEENLSEIERWNIKEEQQIRYWEQLESKIKEQNDKIWKHEEAIYKLANDYNSTAELVLKMSDEIYDAENKNNLTYSQAGEDRIIEFLMSYGEREIRKFSYLDIGCNHYKNINNTYKFYEMGMQGVLIDANPNFIDLAQKYRPKDTCINAGVGEDNSDAMKFYILNNPDLSSFNLKAIEEAKTESSWLNIEKEINVPVFTINYIIETYFDNVPEVISLDIEGDELKALKTIDLKKYRPRIFVIETIEYKASITLNNKRVDIIEFMKSNGYLEYAFTGVNSIFVDEKLYTEENA